MNPLLIMSAPAQVLAPLLQRPKSHILTPHYQG
jgi:hypothetical protein